MTRDQSARLKRHQKVASVLHDHATETATVPALQELIGNYLGQLDLLSPALEQKGRSSKGATETKDDSYASLLGPLVRHANALMLLYKKEGNLEAARNLHTHRSDYARLGAPELASEATTVAKAAKLRQAELAAYGIKPEQVQQLSTAVASFVQAAPAPKTSIEQRKVAGATLRRILKGLDDFLKEDLKAGIELLVDDYPKLYALLHEARRIDAPGYGRSAKAQARKAAKKKGGAAPDAPTPPAAG